MSYDPDEADERTHAACHLALQSAQQEHDQLRAQLQVASDLGAEAYHNLLKARDTIKFLEQRLALLTKDCTHGRISDR